MAFKKFQKREDPKNGFIKWNDGYLRSEQFSTLDDAVATVIHSPEMERFLRKNFVSQGHASAWYRLPGESFWNKEAYGFRLGVLQYRDHLKVEVPFGLTIDEDAGPMIYCVREARIDSPRDIDAPIIVGSFPRMLIFGDEAYEPLALPKVPEFVASVNHLLKHPYRNPLDRLDPAENK